MDELKKILPKHKAENENLLYTRKPRERFTTLKYKYALIDRNITVLGEYINAKTKITHSCDICGHIWDSLGDNILRGHGCPKCNGYYVSQEDFIVKLEDRKNKNVLILSKYINAKTKIECLCKICGYTWNATPDSILRGTGCRKCADKERSSLLKKTTDTFINELRMINDKIEIIGEYTGANDNIACKCIICDYMWSPISSSLLQGCGCPYCSGCITLTHDEFVEKIKEKINENIIILGKYVNSTTKIECKCKKCGYVWDTLPERILKGNGCKKCANKELSKKKMKKHDDFVIQMKDVNSEITVIGKYTGANKKIMCQCKICNHIWEPTPSSLLNGTGCPKCSCSYGEKIISIFLFDNKITFESQKRFNVLKGIGGKSLSYDFYLPQYNLLIEFQGEQHIHAREYFGGEEKLKIQQEHDRRKREYAKQNNINLLEIWYYDIDNIESILLQKINEIKENNLKLESVETVIPA